MQVRDCNSTWNPWFQLDTRHIFVFGFFTLVWCGGNILFIVWKICCSDNSQKSINMQYLIPSLWQIYQMTSSTCPTFKVIAIPRCQIFALLLFVGHGWTCSEKYGRRHCMRPWATSMFKTDAPWCWSSQVQTGRVFIIANLKHAATTASGAYKLSTRIHTGTSF